MIMNCTSYTTFLGLNLAYFLALSGKIEPIVRFEWTSKRAEAPPT
jgi:hypothetical protein